MKLHKLQWYLLKEFLSTLGLCLLFAASVFVVFDFFERMRVFIREGSTVSQVISYVAYKLPLIIHLMTPVAVLIAVLISVGRLSQNSEMTAVRACGISVHRLAFPLVLAGLVISILMFISGETIVPSATRQVENIYNIGIKKKDESGSYSKSDFWYRSGSRFFNISLYNSQDKTLSGLTMLEFDPSFSIERRLYASEVEWLGDTAGWLMKNVTETSFEKDKPKSSMKFKSLPLVIAEKPKDFYDMKIKPEAMSYLELQSFIKERKEEGVPATRQQVDLASKISFPFVNVVLVLIAFPFALATARSGTMTMSFVAGVTIGFSYYFSHAFFTSLAAAELLPIISAAWAANILLGCIGGYLMAGADYSQS